MIGSKVGVRKEERGSGVGKGRVELVVEVDESLALEERREGGSDIMIVDVDVVYFKG